MTTDQLRDIILNELAGIAPESAGVALADGDDLTEVLDLDSMDISNLVIALSARLAVDIKEADVGQMKTLGGAIAYLQSLISAPDRT